MTAAADPPSDPVRAQYEALPYPTRDPADERKRLVTGSPSHILEIDHYLHAGRRDWRRPFRALVAGGGTGDAAIMLAQQLADRAVPGEVVHLDLSTASRAIAEERARVRGLANLRFHTASLLELPALGLGPFDYVDCCGVLHHLEDPPAGLRALAAVLAPGGGLGLMLYGELGRTGVYHVQELLRRLADDRPDRERLALARRLLAALPPTNWLRRNPFVGDHLKGDDAGLYDLLLHRRDRAYRVPEVAALLADAGLRPVAFLEPARYAPESYLGEPSLLGPLAGAQLVERAAAAELIAGNIAKHIAYAVRTDDPRKTVARPDDAALVPAFRELDPLAVARGIRGGGTLKADLDGVPWRAELPPLAPSIAALVDGRRTLAEIHAALAADRPGLSLDRFMEEVRQLFAAFGPINRLLLAGGGG